MKLKSIIAAEAFKSLAPFPFTVESAVLVQGLKTVRVRVRLRVNHHAMEKHASSPYGIA